MWNKLRNGSGAVLTLRLYPYNYYTDLLFPVLLYHCFHGCEAIPIFHMPISITQNVLAEKANPNTSLAEP